MKGNERETVLDGKKKKEKKKNRLRRWIANLRNEKSRRRGARVARHVFSASRAKSYDTRSGAKESLAATSEDTYQCSVLRILMAWTRSQQRSRPFSFSTSHGRSRDSRRSRRTGVESQMRSPRLCAGNLPLSQFSESFSGSDPFSSPPPSHNLFYALLIFS